MEEKIYLWPGEAPYTAESPDQAQPSLTAFPAEGARGAVVVCPGGGYCMKADHEGAPIARMLNSQGIAAYVLDYRVMPCHRLAPWTDASRAIRVVRSLGYEKVGILGFSAGGNLCCTAATHYEWADPQSADPIEHASSRPDVFIPCYPVASFGEYTHLGSRQSLLREDWENDEIARWYSAEENVSENTPPAFLWHTSDDPVVNVIHTYRYATALREHGIPHEVHVFPHGPHGIGLAKDFPHVAQWAPLMKNWLADMGWLN